MDKRTLKRALRAKTGCTVQHDGWPCGTCFFSINSELNNQDWQAVLLTNIIYIFFKETFTDIRNLNTSTAVEDISLIKDSRTILKELKP